MRGDRSTAARWEQARGDGDVGSGPSGWRLNKDTDDAGKGAAVADDVSTVAGTRWGKWEAMALVACTWATAWP